MTGFEYSTASQMLYEGLTEDGLFIYKAIRDRFDGYKRNPFNEGEYGHRYGRAMASWTGVLAFTGFQYSAVAKSMVFYPRNGKYFWSNGYEYGTVEIRDGNNGKSVTLHVVNGDLALTDLALSGYGKQTFKAGKMFKRGQPQTITITNNDPAAGMPVNAKLR